MKIDVLETLKRIQQSNQLVIAWYSFNGHVIQAELNIKAIRKDRNELVFVPKWDSLDYLQQLISGQGKISFFAPEDSLVFIAELRLLGDDGLLTVSMPEKHFFHDRRKDQRVDLLSSLWVSFEKSSLKKRCLDISGGGFSIVVSQAERMLLKQIGSSVSLNLGENCLNLEIELSNELKLRPYMLEKCPYGGFRLAFSFINLNDLLKKRLNDFLAHL